MRIVGVSPTVRSYEVVTVMETEPTAVQLDNQPLPRQAWRYDAAAHQLVATFTAAGFTLVIITPAH